MVFSVIVDPVVVAVPFASVPSLDAVNAPWIPRPLVLPATQPSAAGVMESPIPIGISVLAGGMLAVPAVPPAVPAEPPAPPPALPPVPPAAVVPP